MLPPRQEDGKNSQRKRRKPRLVSQEGQVPVPCPKGQRKDQGQGGRAKNSPCGLALLVCGCMQVPATGSRAAKTGREQEYWRKCDSRSRHHGSGGGVGSTAKLAEAAGPDLAPRMAESLAQRNVSCWAEQTGLASTTTEAVLGFDSGRWRQL